MVGNKPWIGPQPDRPDPNRNVKCDQCGDSYPFQDYWMPRYVKNVEWEPREVAWLCDECIEQARDEYERYKRNQRHAQLSEWS